MLFGVYLVENGVISCEEFFEALKLQIRTRPQLGGLAVERRLLNIRQVFSVLRKQCDSPADLFGELAVQFGYLTPEELTQLIQEQQKRLKPFSEILVEIGILSADAVKQHEREFRRTMEHADEPELVGAK